VAPLCVARAFPTGHGRACTIRGIVPVDSYRGGGIVCGAVRTLVVALVLSTASLVGAQVWVAPGQGFGGRDDPGTL